MRMRRRMTMSQSIVFRHKEVLSVGWLPVAGTLQHSVLLITLYVYILYLWLEFCSYTILYYIYATGTLQHRVLFFYAGTVVSNTMC